MSPNGIEQSAPKQIWASNRTYQIGKIRTKTEINKTIRNADKTKTKVENYDCFGNRAQPGRAETYYDKKGNLSKRQKRLQPELLIFFMVSEMGLEPTQISPYAPETYVSTIPPLRHI